MYLFNLLFVLFVALSVSAQKVVVCVGDSNTAGAGGKYVSYL